MSSETYSDPGWIKEGISKSAPEFPTEKPPKERYPKTHLYLGQLAHLIIQRNLENDLRTPMPEYLEFLGEEVSEKITGAFGKAAEEIKKEIVERIPENFDPPIFFNEISSMPSILQIEAIIKLANDPVVLESLGDFRVVSKDGNEHPVTSVKSALKDFITNPDFELAYREENIDTTEIYETARHYREKMESVKADSEKRALALGQHVDFSSPLSVPVRLEMSKAMIESRNSALNVLDTLDPKQKLETLLGLSLGYDYAQLEGILGEKTGEVSNIEPEMRKIIHALAARPDILGLCPAKNDDKAQHLLQKFKEFTKGTSLGTKSLQDITTFSGEEMQTLAEISKAITEKRIAVMIFELKTHVKIDDTPTKPLKQEDDLAHTITSLYQSLTAASRIDSEPTQSQRSLTEVRTIADINEPGETVESIVLKNIGTLKDVFSLTRHPNHFSIINVDYKICIQDMRSIGAIDKRRIDQEPIVSIMEQSPAKLDRALVNRMSLKTHLSGDL